MADCIKIGNLDISAVKIGSTDPIIYVGEVKVYPTIEPLPENYMFYAKYSDGTTYSAECASSAETLTTATTRAHSTSYTAMTKAWVGDCVTKISNGIIGNVFRDCKSLKTIYIPDSVTNIGSYVFYECQSLREINLPSGITRIEGYLFADCVSLATIVIPSGVTSIGGNAFNSCRSLTSIDIPSGVTTIGNYAFYYCNGLTSITVNATTPPTLGNYAFDNTNDCPIYVPCNSVKTYKSASGWSTYASRIQAIPDSCKKFYATYSDGTDYTVQCNSSSTLTTDEARGHSTPYSAMTTAVIGDCATRIESATFYNFPNLESIILSDNLTSIESYTFSRCKKLVSIEIPSGVTSIGSNAFSSCSDLTTINIPSGVTSIDNYIFTYCSKLSAVTIPSDVTQIGNSSFSSCGSLTSIDIPSGVTSIGNSAFYYCNSLTSITVNATTPPTLGTNVFYNTNDCPIYVPCDSVDAFKAASVWSTYASRIQPISGTCLDCNWNQYQAYDAVPQNQIYAARIDMNVDMSNGYFIDFGDGGLGYLSIKRETTSNVWKVVTEQGETPIVFDANDKATIKFSDYGFETMVIDEMSLFDGLPFDIELCESSE